MKTRRVLVFVSTACLIAACGSRTGLLVPTHHDGGEPVDATEEADAFEEPEPDAFDAGDAVSEPDAVEEDVFIPPDAPDICPDAGSTVIYVITTQGVLLSFYPPTGTFTTIGTVTCPSPAGDEPFSMAVSRTGVAYIVYTPSGTLYRVSTKTAQCGPTAFVPGNSGFPTVFGMGFSADVGDAGLGAEAGETLYLAGDPGGVGVGNTLLGALDVQTFKTKTIGAVNPPILVDRAHWNGQRRTVRVLPLERRHGFRRHRPDREVERRPSVFGEPAHHRHRERLGVRVLGRRLLHVHGARRDRHGRAALPAQRRHRRDGRHASGARRRRRRRLHLRAADVTEGSTLAEMAATTGRGSFVSFVSLGPGDPALRTVRAAARLAEADVVVDCAELAEGSAAERLIALAREGKHVARAVEGDTTASVRVLREVLAVAAAGIPFEVVPGIGARPAAAAYAGVVGRARRVRVDEVERELQGEPGEAVVTLVAHAGLPSQRVEITTAAEAPAVARSMSPGPFGLVVSLGAPDQILRWYERQPLFGKRVLVTRAREQAGKAEALLREAGAEPVVVPTIVLGPPDDPAPLARAVVDLRAGVYGWVAFTSANGVDHTWQAVVAAGGDARAFGRARLAAIGPATAAALEQHGLTADVQAKEFKGEGLAEEMLRHMGPASAPTPGAPGRSRVLVARAAKAREVLPEALRAAGWTVDVVAAYQTRAPGPPTLGALVHDLEAGRIDVVTFTSSSTVDNLCELLGPDAVRLLARPRIASIGPITTETAKARGLRVDVTASEYTLPGLVQSLARALGPAN